MFENTLEHIKYMEVPFWIIYKDWLYALLKTEPIPPEDIPDIGLDMDQVTTLMDIRLAGSKRYPDDKILNKNNDQSTTRRIICSPLLTRRNIPENMSFFSL